MADKNATQSSGTNNTLATGTESGSGVRATVSKEMPINGIIRKQGSEELDKMTVKTPFSKARERLGDFIFDIQYNKLNWNNRNWDMAFMFGTTLAVPVVFPGGLILSIEGMSLSWLFLYAPAAFIVGGVIGSLSN